MSSIVGKFEGTILGATFGIMDPDPDQSTPPYAFGDLAGLGWSCRFSIRSDFMPVSLRETLQSGADVPVVMTGTAIAEQKRAGVIVKVKATGVDFPPSASNGSAKADATAKA